MSSESEVSFIKHPRTAIKRFLANRKPYVSAWGSYAFGDPAKLVSFQQAFEQNLKRCAWNPHPRYSVFTQYDQSFYLKLKREFLHKYKCFYAVSKTIAPRRILELGTHAGSGADAYLSASPGAEYFGFDQFEDGVLQGTVHEITAARWQPRETATRLLEERGFKNYQLIKSNLREMTRLPVTSDFVVVDAAHDFDNEYADLKLALTAQPSFIFVDDSDSPAGAQPAIRKFLDEDVEDRVDYYFGVSYYGGGLVIKLK